MTTIRAVPDGPLPQSTVPGITRLMVIDDSDVQRRHAASLCRSLGVDRVYEARHGADALELLAGLGEQPDALIIDLEMPVMDGVELIRELQQRDVDIPFIIASTREISLIGAVEAMARAHGLPVAQAMRKPLTDSALREALERCARGRAVRPIRRSDMPPTPATPIDGPMLSRAIAAGAIVPHYQPKVDARTGVIRGLEVLARWPDATLGHPAPDRFIPAAEALGLIHPLTMSMLDQTMAQAAFWRSRGLRLPLAINLSPRLLESAGLVDEICACLERHRVPASQVVLEITESSVVAYHGDALGVLARLRMKGFGLSIDDYGTGFSSMQQLSRMPWTELKIDRSFVDGAHRHAHLRAILQSSIEMASRLGIVSVAEGVESIDDWRLLQSYGCTVGQGWLFGKAMAAPDLRAWLKLHADRLPLLRGQGPVRPRAVLESVQ